MFLARARGFAGLLFLCVVNALSACTTFAPQTGALLTQPPPGLPLSAEIGAVPYFAHTEHHCGPAALAMVLGAAGTKVTPEQLSPQVYLPGRQGSLQIEMLAAARRNGMVAYVLEPELDHLLLEINDGTPVITLENYGVPYYPQWHYAVALGFDLHRRQILRHSGTLERKPVPLSVFEYFWRKEGRWAMVAVAPERVPLTASEPRYAEAVIALEKTGQNARAAAAYDAMLQRWPTSLAALMGRGNTAHALGDLARAEAAFREAAKRHPNATAAYNNLAQTLADRGELGEARAMAEHAVALGGPLRERAVATLEGIRKRQAVRDASRL